MKKAVLIISLFLLTAMAPGSQTGLNKEAVSPFDADKFVNVKAPDFVLKDINGKDVALSSFKGKVVLLNFWATWCPPCKHEMPSFNKLYTEMKAQGLEIIAISTDDSISYVKDYLRKNSFDFKILMDEKRITSKQYKVFSMPTTFLIDRNGIIIEKFHGEYDWTDPEIKKKIEKL
ncbi:MAG: hypothetical protein A2X59_12945 [Nitrospirae bacterium GWC2_42_7]|nr:MAG: hypothetical protein A2X59_12945 [Nitrospirae bacterium GWC2_42_7]